MLVLRKVGVVTGVVVVVVVLMFLVPYNSKRIYHMRKAWPCDISDGLIEVNVIHSCEPVKSI